MLRPNLETVLPAKAACHSSKVNFLHRFSGRSLFLRILSHLPPPPHTQLYSLLLCKKEKGLLDSHPNSAKQRWLLSLEVFHTFDVFIKQKWKLIFMKLFYCDKQLNFIFILATSHVVHKLLLPLCSGTIPGSAQETIGGIRDQIKVGHMQRQVVLALSYISNRKCLL